MSDTSKYSKELISTDVEETLSHMPKTFQEFAFLLKQITEIKRKKRNSAS